MLNAKFLKFKFLAVGLMSCLLIGYSAQARRGPSAVGAGSTVKAEFETLLDEMSKLGAGEKETDLTIEKLKKRPREQVLQAMRDALRVRQHKLLVIMRAAVALEAKEILPELREVVSSTDSWQIFSATNRLLEIEPNRAIRSSYSSVYLQRLDGKFPAASRMAVIDGLSEMKIPIPRSHFQRLLKDQSYEVRGAAVRNFLLTRTELTKQEQIQRFREAFRTKPYQVRYEAMKIYSELPVSDRLALRAAISQGLCENEEHFEVKELCQELLKGLRGGTAYSPAVPDEDSPGKAPEREPAQGEVESEEILNIYRYRIQKALYDALTVSEPECPGCVVQATAGQPRKMDRCDDQYRDFFANEEIDIRVAFGYLDYKNETEDQYAAAAFIESLTGPCYEGMGACGFNRDPDDAELFFKTVKGPGGKNKKVKIRIASSSASGSERANRNELKSLQEAATKRAENVFLKGLTEADAVFYIGHARDGGGPDFAPPVINTKTRRTDYDWYTANKPGEKKMLEALGKGRRQPKILGLFACYSTEKFGPQLRTAAPNTGLITTDRSDFESITAQAYMALDSALALRCTDDFKRSLNTIKNVNGVEIGPVKIEGGLFTTELY